MIRLPVIFLLLPIALAAGEAPEPEPEVPNPDVRVLELPVEEVEVEDVEVPLGREEAVVGGEGRGAFMAIGAPAANGLYLHRSGGAKRRAIGRYGGSKASMNATRLALRFFQRHQSPDGYWDADGYPDHCALEGPRCEPDPDGVDADLIATATILSCYLADGYDHKVPNQFQQAIRQGFAWLVLQQREDGGWGEGTEAAAAAATVIFEAYGMTHDPALLKPADRAVAYLQSRQNEDGGWDPAGPAGRRSDTFLTARCITALTCARGSGLEAATPALRRAELWLDKAWMAINPDRERLNPAKDPTNFPAVLDGISGTAEGDGLAGTGAWCALLLDRRPGDPVLDSLVRSVVITLTGAEKDWPGDGRRLHLASQALFHHCITNVAKMDPWTTWFPVMRDHLVQAQRAEPGCFEGSYDPPEAKAGQVSPGRLLTTARATLILAFYRFQLPRVTVEKL